MRKTYTKPTLVRREQLIEVSATIVLDSKPTTTSS
jgi:hypothetical protein